MLLSEEFVYYGTSAFSADILAGLIVAGLKPKLVVSTSPQPAGRGLKAVPTPVSQLAQQNNLRLLEIDTLKNTETFNKINHTKTSFAILAAFGKIIPENVLTLYKKGIVNIHPSLLPLYRGPAPIQYAIKDGQTVTGVSLIILDEEIDHGPILTQKKCLIVQNDDANTLSKKLSLIATQLLIKTLPDYLNNKLRPSPQNHPLANFTKIIKREDGQANFNKGAIELDKQRRAFTPWPGLWTTWRGKRLKFINTTPLLEKPPNQPGTINVENNKLKICTAQDVLLINELQLEGGKILLAADFIRGHTNCNNNILPS